MRGPNKKLSAAQLHNQFKHTMQSEIPKQKYETVEYKGFTIKIYPPMSDFGYGPYCVVERHNGVPVLGRSGLDKVKQCVDEIVNTYRPVKARPPKRK